MRKGIYTILVYIFVTFCAQSCRLGVAKRKSERPMHVFRFSALSEGKRDNLLFLMSATLCWFKCAEMLRNEINHVVLVYTPMPPPNGFLHPQPALWLRAV